MLLAPLSTQSQLALHGLLSYIRKGSRLVSITHRDELTDNCSKRLNSAGVDSEIAPYTVNVDTLRVRYMY